MPVKVPELIRLSATGNGNRLMIRFTLADGSAEDLCKIGREIVYYLGNWKIVDKLVPQC